MKPQCVITNMKATLYIALSSTELFCLLHCDYDHVRCYMYVHNEQQFYLVGFQ